MHPLGWRFFLTCFGVLGCYAGLRTLRQGWAKALIVLVLVVCLTQLALNDWFDRPENQPTVRAPAQAANVLARGLGDFIHKKYDAFRTETCMLSYLRETPLSPLVYLAQVDNFLDGFKRLQVSTGGAGGLGEIAPLVAQSFGETEPDYSAAEQAAVNGAGNRAPLCTAFGKWLAKVKTYAPNDQQQIWQSFSERLRQPPAQ